MVMKGKIKFQISLIIILLLTLINNNNIFSADYEKKAAEDDTLEMFALAGFATVNYEITGGTGGETVVVTDYSELSDYAQALDVLNKADPEHGCVKKVLSDVKQVSKKQAEMHYLRGVKHFLNEEITDAIKEWNKALALDPDDKKTQDSIKKARDLLKKLEQVE